MCLYLELNVAIFSRQYHSAGWKYSDSRYDVCVPIYIIIYSLEHINEYNKHNKKKYKYNK